MRIGIVGAGPSGSYLAYRLAQNGFEVLLLDKFVSREKPCGGGVTDKALSAFPLITESSIPRTKITQLQIIDPEGAPFELALNRPLSIYSRRELDAHLAQCAQQAGARFVAGRVVEVVGEGSGWRIRSTDAEHRVDFLVGADGAKSMVRAKLVGPFAKRDLATTAGYYVPGNYHSSVAICRFLGQRFRGYLWSFPRYDHLSVGIISDLAGAQSLFLRQQVRAFIREHYPHVVPDREVFYSAVAPEVHFASWKTLTFCGPSWALVGDAAGFVDPVTGEGIYYALRSAELLAQALQTRDLAGYRQACFKEFIDGFISAGRWKARFGNYYTLIARVIIGSRRSATLQALENEFVAGTLTYKTAPAAFLKKMPQIIGEILVSKLRSLPSSS